MTPEWKFLKEAFEVEESTQNKSNKLVNEEITNRISKLETLMTATGLSHREILEDAIDTLSDEEFNLLVGSLREKYGFMR